VLLDVEPILGQLCDVPEVPLVELPGLVAVVVLDCANAPKVTNAATASIARMAMIVMFRLLGWNPSLAEEIGVIDIFLFHLPSEQVLRASS
jgi:hypothetical protein